MMDKANYYSWFTRGFAGKAPAFMAFCTCDAG